MGSPLASLDILITGDFSDLEQSITDATSAATTAGQAIAQAFDQPDAGNQVAVSIDAIGTAATDAQDQLSLFGTAVLDSNEQMDLFDTNAISAAESMQQIGDGAETAATGVGEAGEAVEAAGVAASESSEMWGELSAQLLEFAGISVTIEAFKELASEVIEAFSTIQNATVAFTAMTGSAAGAAEQIEGLESLANTDALSFPSLLSAAQKMTAFGMSADETTQALGLAADAAAATGNSFDQVSNSLDRIVASGTAGARQLVQLGITQQQLAAIMGVATTQVTADFKAMDPSDRLAVMSAALQKFSGDAQLMVDTVQGATNELANAWEHTAATIGSSIGPMVAGLEQATAYVVSGFGVMWTKTIGEVQSQWQDFMVFLQTGSTEGFAAFQAGAQEAQAGVAVIVAAFAQGKSAAEQFQTATASMFSKLNDNQTALTNLAINLDTANQRMQTGQITTAQYQTVVDAFGKAFDAASTNGAKFADTLLGVDSAQSKATVLLNESLSTLQQVTPGTADYARAVQDVGSAWNAANPGGVQFNDTMMGIGQAVSQQSATLRSLEATFSQVSAGFSAGTTSANLFLAVASKLASTAAAAHVPFADVNVDIQNIAYATGQAATQSAAAIGAFNAINDAYAHGTVNLQELLTALQDAENAANKAGTAFTNAAAAALQLNQNAHLQVQTFQSDIAVLGQYANTTGQTAEQSIAAAAALKNLQTAGQALGITVTQVAGAQNTFNIATTNATPAVQGLVQQLTQLFSQQGLTITATNHVTEAVNGVSTALGQGGVLVTTFGDNSATAAPKVAALGSSTQSAAAGQAMLNAQLADPFSAKAVAATASLTEYANMALTASQVLNGTLTPALHSAVSSGFDPFSAAAVAATANTSNFASSLMTGTQAIDNAAAHSSILATGATALGDAINATATGFTGLSSTIEITNEDGTTFNETLEQTTPSLEDATSAADAYAASLNGVASAASSATSAVDNLDSASSKGAGGAGGSNSGEELGSYVGFLSPFANVGPTSMNVTDTAMSGVGGSFADQIEQVNAELEQLSGAEGTAYTGTIAATDVLVKNTAATSDNTTATTSNTTATAALTTATTAAVTATQALSDVNSALGTNFTDLGSATTELETLIATTSGGVKQSLEALMSEINGVNAPVQDVAYSLSGSSTSLSDTADAAASSLTGLVSNTNDLSTSTSTASGDVLGVIANLRGMTLTTSGLNADMASLTQELQAGQISLSDFNEESQTLSSTLAQETQAVTNMGTAASGAAQSLNAAANSTQVSADVIQKALATYVQGQASYYAQQSTAGQGAANIDTANQTATFNALSALGTAFTNSTGLTLPNTGVATAKINPNLTYDPSTGAYTLAVSLPNLPNGEQITGTATASGTSINAAGQNQLYQEAYAAAMDQYYGVNPLAAPSVGGLSNATGQGIAEPFYGLTGLGTNVPTGTSGGIGYTGAPSAIPNSYQPATPAYSTGNPLPVVIQNQPVPNITINIPGATVVGSNGAQQLAQAVQQQIVTTLRQAGLKL